MTTIQKKVAYAFNKFYLDLINDVKSYDEELKKIVKAKFKVFDKTALSHIESFRTQIAQGKNEQDVELIPGMRTSVMVEDMDESNRNIMKSYYYIFRCLANIYDDEDEKMIDVVLEIIGKVRSGEDVTFEIDGVVDDDLKKDLNGLRAVLVDIKKPSMEDTMKMFENSMIGSLAKEISEEINVKDLNIEDPSELLNFQNMTGTNNVLGDIVSKVSSKIQTKIQDGKLNQSDLISEAMSMIGMLNNFGGAGGAGGVNNGLMDMMANINKTMGGATGLRMDEAKLRNLDTRARLRKKLDDKRPSP
jgi:hypothetical protein